MKKSDFTLIELLLISGTCIVAAALVMPCRVIADGKSVSCTDNLRKIGKVIACLYICQSHGVGIVIIFQL